MNLSSLETIASRHLCRAFLLICCCENYASFQCYLQLELYSSHSFMILSIVSASLRLHVTHKVLNLHHSSKHLYPVGRPGLALNYRKLSPPPCPVFDSTVPQRSRLSFNKTNGMACPAISSPKIQNGQWAQSKGLPIADLLLAPHAPWDPIRPLASKLGTKTW